MREKSRARRAAAEGRGQPAGHSEAGNAAGSSPRDAARAEARAPPTRPTLANGVQCAPPLPWAERRPEGDRYASPEPEMRPGSPYVAEHAQWERAEEDELSPLRPPRPSTAVPWRDGDAHGQERARPQSALA